MHPKRNEKADNIDREDFAVGSKGAKESERFSASDTE